jgi:non-specific serine/threonine protein kinase
MSSPVDNSDAAIRAALAWRFGEAELDEARLELRLKGAPVEIERKPLELLMLLLRHPGEVVTKEELIDTLWAGRVVSDSVLTKCVAKLRQALGDEDQTQIKTAHGYGYRFMVPVTRLVTRAAPEPPPPSGLKEGDQPPLRPNWRLVRRFTGARGESWLAEHSKTRELRVFKMATDAEGLAQIKREITLHRLVRDTFGQRDDLIRILDWNLEEAPYFLEVDYCALGNLDEYFASQGGAAHVALTTRLDLVARVADALAACHSAGVLHKDLKPANIFVEATAGGLPTIRLGDFGSGRVLEPDRLQAMHITRLGFTQSISANETTSGTWAYLAPEVVALQPPTIRSDIYSLGVMLYQVVVGDLRRPLAPGWEREVEDELLREDIAAAADTEPARRLSDAGELAQRLRTLESRRAARAAQRSAAADAEQTRRALERAQARRGWLLAVTAVSVIALVITGVSYLRLQDSRDEAEAASQRAAREAAISASVVRFMNEDMLGAVSPYSGVGSNVTVREAVDRASQVVGQRFAEQPHVAAAVHAALGGLYTDLGDIAASDRELQLAADLYRKKVEDPARLFDVLIRLSGNAWDNSRPQAAVGIAEEAVTVAESIRPIDAARRVQAAGELAWVQYQSDEPDAAVPALAESYRQAVALGPDAADVADTIRFRLARTHVYGGTFDEAEPLLREHVAHRIAIRGEDHLDTAFALRDLGTNLALQGRFEESLQTLERVLGIQRARLPTHHREVLETRNELATTHYRARDFATAATQWLSLAEDGSRHEGESHSITITALGNAATALRHQGEFARALPIARRAMEAEARMPDVRPANALVTRFKYAQALLDVGRAADALRLLEDMWGEVQTAFPATSFWPGDVALRRGEALGRVGRKADALPWVEHAIERYSKAEGIDDRRLSEARGVLAALKK